MAPVRLAARGQIRLFKPAGVPPTLTSSLPLRTASSSPPTSSLSFRLSSHTLHLRHGPKEDNHLRHAHAGASIRDPARNLGKANRTHRSQAASELAEAGGGGGAGEGGGGRGAATGSDGGRRGGGAARAGAGAGSGLHMEQAEAEFAVAQANEMVEQQAIPESIQDEAYVKANQRFIRLEWTATTPSSTRSKRDGCTCRHEGAAGAGAAAGVHVAAARHEDSGLLRQRLG